MRPKQILYLYLHKWIPREVSEHYKKIGYKISYKRSIKYRYRLFEIWDCNRKNALFLLHFMGNKVLYQHKIFMYIWGISAKFSKQYKNILYIRYLNIYLTYCIADIMGKCLQYQTSNSVKYIIIVCCTAVTDTYTQESYCAKISIICIRVGWLVRQMVLKASWNCIFFQSHIFMRLYIYCWDDTEVIAIGMFKKIEAVVHKRRIHSTFLKK